MAPRYRATRQRNGVTAVMAMLYMVLFAAMALGFYATVTTSVALAKNDQKAAKALLAAESGVQFMRLHLAQVLIPPATPLTEVMTELHKDLRASLESTGNLGTHTVELKDNIIRIPAESGAYIMTDSTDNSGFSVAIMEQAGRVICKVIGQTGNGKYQSSKGVRLDFTREPIETNLFDNAVAARGRVIMQKGTLSGVAGISPNTIANIMSAKATAPALSMTGGSVGGDLGIVSPGLANVTGGSVHGTSNLTTIYNNYVKVAPAPEFPVIDTNIFAPYATNVYSGSGSVLKNVRIPANTNPKFTGGATVQGIVYIESPNVVEFRGTVDMQGFIIFENAGNSATNVLDMGGNFTHHNLPDGAEFDALRSITGISVLAPTAKLSMTGSVDSFISGNVIVGKFINAGSADIQMDAGTLMGMDPGDSVVFNGKNVKWTSTGASNQPTPGVLFSETYNPVAGSYQELNQ